MLLKNGYSVAAAETEESLLTGPRPEPVKTGSRMPAGLFANGDPLFPAYGKADLFAGQRTENVVNCSAG